MSQRATRWSITCALALLAALAIAAAAGAGNGKGAPLPDGNPHFTTAGSAAPLPTSRTIPHWSFAYTDPQNRVSYTMTMVGTDPRLGGSTTVKTVIVPLAFNFVAGNQNLSVLNPQYASPPYPTPLNLTMDPTADAAKVLASPIYSSYEYPADMGGDVGQYGDAFMRAQFGKLGTGYHVRIENQSTLPTIAFDVPQSKGAAYVRPAGAVAGVVDEQWFSTRVQSLLGSLHLDPTTVPIFLTHNVLLFGNSDYSNCCTVGYHGASKAVGNGGGSINGNGNQPVQTYVYAAYVTPNTYTGFNDPAIAARRGMADIHPLSHELAEWLDDPFVTNAVKPWIADSAPQYGCTALLETGDPVVGVWFPLPGNPDPGANGVWHPEDEVNLNWFAHDGQPAGLGSWDGRYTFMGPHTIAIGGGYAAFAHSSNPC